MKNTMKRVIAITVVSVFASAALASGQSATSSQEKPLAEIAKAEEARRKVIKKTQRIYTNSSLRIAADSGTSAPATSAASGGAAASTTAPPPDAPAEAASDERGKDRGYWEGRIKTAREQLSRSQMFADSLQSRINALTTDFVNRDDPAQRAKIEADRKAALAELDRVKKEMSEHQKAIAVIEEEARRAGVPAGWLRPGA
jgi:hypothetical protein